MQNIKSFEDAKRLWSTAVGEFIIEFTQIEQILHLVIERYLTDKLVTNENLVDSIENRIKLMQLIIKDKLTEKNFFELQKHCQTLLRLKDTRNLIVHNSLVLIIEQNNLGEIKVGEYEIGSLRKNKKSIKYTRLVSDINQLKKTITQLSAIIVSAN